MTRVSDNFFKLTTDIGDGYILRREGDIVTGISTQELLSGISGGSLPNTFPYTTYIDPNTTSLGTPDGSLSNPFLTINDAVSAIDSSIISLPEYIIKLAPGTYSSGSVVPVFETTRNYHFVGESVDSTICSDWVITGSGGTIVFEQCNVISTGSWDQTGYNLTFINCSVDITSLANLIIPANGLLRFIDTVGRFGGATISDTNTYLERDGRSKWGLVMNIPFVGNEPKIRDACAIPQSSNEYWVNNNNSAYKTNSLGWPVANGTVAHPYNLLGDCLDQLDILGIQYATVHLAPSNFAYVYDNANITTQLCIIGDGTVKDCRINQFTCESMILEVRNCYFLTSEFSVRMLKAVNCVIDANITIDTKMEFIDCKIEDDSNFIRVYTALTSAIWYVDLYSNYYSDIIPVTLVNIEKTILGNVSGVDGYNIGLTYVPVNYSVPSSNIIGEHIAEIDSRLGNIVAGGIALSAGTNSKNSGTVSFVNSNGLSWGMDTAGAITGSISVTAGGAAISAGTNSRNSGTISFANSNGVSFGMDTAGLLTASVSVAAGGFAISAGSNSKNSGTISFASNSNGISCGMDTAGLITWSTTQQAQSTIAISAGTNSRNTGSVIFSNSNGISFGMDTAGAITASTTQQAQTTLAISAGTNSKNSGTIVFASASNGISCGMDTAGSITWSTTQPTQMTVGVGTNTVSGNSVVFADSNGVSFGMATGTGGGTITASVAAAAQAPFIMPLMTKYQLYFQTDTFGTKNNQHLNNVIANLVPFSISNNCSISEYRESFSLKVSGTAIAINPLTSILRIEYQEYIGLYSYHSFSSTWGLVTSTVCPIVLSRSMSQTNTTVWSYSSSVVFNGVMKSTSGQYMTTAGSHTNFIDFTSTKPQQMVMDLSATLTPGVYGILRFSSYSFDSTITYNYITNSQISVFYSRVGANVAFANSFTNYLNIGHAENIVQYKNSVTSNMIFGNSLAGVSYFGLFIPITTSISTIPSSLTNLGTVMQHSDRITMFSLV